MRVTRHSPDYEPRCKDGVHYTGFLRATGPDRPDAILKLTRLLKELDLDITSLTCNQRTPPQQRHPATRHSSATRHSAARHPRLRSLRSPAP